MGTMTIGTMTIETMAMGTMIIGKAIRDKGMECIYSDGSKSEKGRVRAAE